MVKQLLQRISLIQDFILLLLSHHQQNCLQSKIKLHCVYLYSSLYKSYETNKFSYFYNFVEFVEFDPYRQHIYQHKLKIMGNQIQNNGIQQFDYKQFKAMMKQENQEQQYQLQKQEKVSKQLLNQFKCIYVNHAQKQIEGICVNLVCKAINRRTCYDCIVQEIHEKDYLLSQKSNKTQNADKLNNLIKVFQIFLNRQIDQLKYCLYLEQLKLTNETNQNIGCLKGREVKKIETKIKQIQLLIDKINIKEYIQLQYETNLGIFNYFLKFYEKLCEIPIEFDQYQWLKQNAHSLIHHFEINKQDVEQFQELKKKKSIIIQKITQTQVYKNQKIEQKDLIFISEQIKDVYELGQLIKENGYNLIKLIQDLYFNQVQNFLDFGDYGRAIHSLDQIIQLNPQNEKAYYDKGQNSYILKGQYFMIQIDFMNQFRCLIKLDCQIQNIKMFIHYQEYHFINQRDMNKLSNVLQDLNNLIDQMKELFIFKVKIYSQIGIVLMKLQRFIDALQVFDSILQSNPKCYKAYLNKGLSLVYIERYDEAIQMFEIFFIQNPQAKFQSDYITKILGQIQFYIIFKESQLIKIIKDIMKQY
ncbi:hypothetical protein pb186bvf_018482 [Paramecium bursaria]